MIQLIPYFKLFHLFFLFVWIGSLLYLTRLLGNGEKNDRLLQKIYFYTDLPAMCLAIGLGLILLFFKGVDMRGWFHMKLTFALLLVALDIMTGRAIFRRSGAKKYFRYLHFLVYLFLFAILFAVYVLKPPTFLQALL